MFSRSAPYYDLLYGFKDYGAASLEIEAVIRRHAPEARTLLDVACGTGRHLVHLRERFDVEGLDLNPELLAIARRRCPGVPMHQADMTDFSLPGQFNVVTCLFSSIAYLKTTERLMAGVATMRRHLSPGGVMLIEPWFTPENLWTETVTANFVEEPDIKISWMYRTEEPTNNVVSLDINYLVGTPERVEHFTERHEFGVFSHEQYCAAIEATGLRVTHDATGPFGRGLYVGSS